ncbi:MAG TPA: nitroreductase family protein [Planctomycetota bacterium]|jgi:nitroreductase|nr:nitroreductase family protein [Planctomycetota bacterium]
MDRPAPVAHPIHELLARRWSPRAFDARPVEPEKLRILLEAARWAPSSFNEQPWSYLLATREEAEGFARMLECLVEGNRLWAKEAPVLMLAVASLRFARNAKENRHAFHDVGLATENLAVQATAMGLFVHQMAGILPERAREVFAIPEGHEAATGIALGYPGDPASLPEKLRAAEAAPRTRKPLEAFVFSGRWGSVAPVVRS